MEETSYVNKKILSRIVELFVVKEKRKRLIEFMESPKRYDDFLDELLRDPRNLEPEYIVNLPNNPQTPETILQKLRELGAGQKAYLVSVDYNVDGKTGSLKETLALVSGNGSIVYCLNSNLAYYEGHEGWQYIFHAV